MTRPHFSATTLQYASFAFTTNYREVADMESCGDILRDRMHNQKWFTARGLKSLSDATGWQVDSLARLIAVLLLFLLTRSSNWLVCNTILVIIPMLLTFEFPDEKPPAENMRIYWISAFVMTAFDRMLEAFPFYYVVKLSTLLFLLVEPSFLNDNLRKLLTVAENSISQVRRVKPVGASPVVHILHEVAKDLCQKTSTIEILHK
ncbi:unnamed protein product [Strongylus vulgaris]|uniref:Receptor expression-enhancing protein n=1 Tax=Strongylus vulgaris TaxID=40348 RepID=A0A3P7IKM8_STRVU|nr:unnamed protein product [Strongylus vulgaris]